MVLAIIAEAATAGLGESWPVLGAFLAIQTAITGPIVGWAMKRDSDARKQLEARLGDKDNQIAKGNKDMARLRVEMRGEIDRLQSRNDDLMQMAFEAVRGITVSADTAQEAASVARTAIGGSSKR
jgi:hypothetical protein